MSRDREWRTCLRSRTILSRCEFQLGYGSLTRFEGTGGFSHFGLEIFAAHFGLPKFAAPVSCGVSS
jgi:hypothetical protein